ncbi:MAG: GDP-mannose 4,6-dehydratase [Gemmatimonadota bacterium]|nr:GDP-mannose 4,6-dehydratase [Gemmatimonadota bacterium]
MERALVTGASGFVGQWLCRELLARDWDVTGTTFDVGASPSALTADERTSVRWLAADLRDGRDIVRALDDARPDAIFHLAGVSFLPAADADPVAALDVNVVGTGRLLAELRARKTAGVLDPMILIVGSAEQYGRHDVSAMPLPETAEQRPLNVYAASKAAQEIIALESFRSAGLRIVATRSFNHSGAGQAPTFLLPALARRALDARATLVRDMPIGNSSPVRDFLHVRDVTRAYADLVERGQPGECYNVASGVGSSVRTLAERIIQLTGARVDLREDPALVRAADVPVLVGDAGKLRAATGWSPRESVDTIIEDVIRAASN